MKMAIPVSYTHLDVYKRQRDVQRLELPLLLRLKPFGGVDTVIFQDLR